jgi:hypothetical protein
VKLEEIPPQLNAAGREWRRVGDEGRRDASIFPNNLQVSEKRSSVLLRLTELELMPRKGQELLR